MCTNFWPVSVNYKSGLWSVCQPVQAVSQRNIIARVMPLIK